MGKAGRERKGRYDLRANERDEVKAGRWRMD